MSAHVISSGSYSDYHIAAIVECESKDTFKRLAEDFSAEQRRIKPALGDKPDGELAALFIKYLLANGCKEYDWNQAYIDFDDWRVDRSIMSIGPFTGGPQFEV